MKKSEVTLLFQKLHSDYHVDVESLSDAKIIRLLQETGLVTNLYQELEMDSPYAQAQADVSYTEDMIQLHSHFFYEILLCHSGNVQYLIGTDRYRMQKGDIVFIPPGISHRPLFLEQLVEPYDREVMWISPELMEQIRQISPEMKTMELHHYLLRTAGTEWADLDSIFKQAVVETEQKKRGWQATCYALAMMLITNLMRASQNIEAPIAERQELLDEIMLYIEHHMAEKLSLNQISQHFHVSTSTVSQTFRKHLNVSFYQFVTQRRLIAAKNLIQTGISLEHTATEVGFGDYSNFYRAFLKEYGITPAAYRQILRQK